MKLKETNLNTYDVSICSTADILMMKYFEQSYRKESL
jgi:hypothetical protein